jgi:hypothetical protein
MSVRSLGKRRSHLLGSFDVVTMRVSMDVLDGSAWGAGDDYEALLKRWGVTQVDDIPRSKWGEFSQQLRALFRRHERAFRTAKHEECHLRQNGSMPFCFSCALALRQSMASLRRELKLASLTWDLIARPLPVPLFGADAAQLPPRLSTAISNIDAIYRSWAIANGEIEMDEYRKALRDTFGSRCDIHNSITHAGFESTTPKEQPMGALAIIEGMAKIAEIFDFGLLVDDREYIECSCERELLGGKDIYGATCRFVANALGTAPLMTAIITMLLSDISMLTLPSYHWPVAFGPNDNPLDVLPGARFSRLVEMATEDKFGVVRQLMDGSWYERLVTSADPKFDIRRWFRAFVEEIYEIAGWTPYEQMAQQFVASVVQAAPLLVGLSPEKSSLLSYGSTVRQTRSGYTVALPWHTTSIHEQKVHPFLTSARIWLNNGLVMGDRAFAFEAVEELWQVAHFSWYNGVLETGDLFGRSPIPEVPYLLCCQSRERCSQNLSDVPSDCQWINCFEEMIGVPPRCFVRGRS